jgi:hypothetical protein
MSSRLDNRGHKEQATLFRRFAERLSLRSKEVFLEDGYHPELYFLVDGVGDAMMIPAPADADSDHVLAVLKQRILDEDIYGVIHIAESWTYFGQKRSNYTLKRIAEGEIKVSEMPPKDRGEVLLVMMESRAGARFLWLTPILRVGYAVALGSTLAFPEESAGRFGGLFEP